MQTASYRRIAFLAGCGLLISAIVPAQNEVSDSLTTGTWALVRIQSMDDREWMPGGNDSFTLKFLDSGELQIRADCNLGHGSWTSEGKSQLLLDSVAMGSAECAPDSLHDRFLRELPYVRSYVFRKSNLFLATLADGSIIEFQPLAMVAGAPSFDCAKATGSVQEAICENPDLAALDRRLDAVYRKALETFPDDEQKELKAYQRGWIKGRDDCWKADAMKACVTGEYQRRITELEIRTAENMVPAAQTFACSDGEQVTVYFYNDTEIPAMVINSHSEQEFLYRATAASGAKYQGRNIMFWQKGSSAQLQWNGRQVNCEPASSLVEKKAPERGL